jgi:Niemann-Pick C1 protein
LSDFLGISAGTSYDNEQELHAHPSGLPDNEMDETGYFERLGAKTESFLEQFFTVWGTYCANNPWKILLAGESRDPLAFQ